MSEENNKKNSSLNDLKNIHTYTSDMADAIRDNETSVIKIALAEKEKRESEEIYKQAEGTNTSKFFLIIGGIILIVIAIAITYYFINKNTTPAIQTDQVSQNIDTFISYDSKVYLDVTESKNQNDLSNILKVELDKKEKTGSIKAIFLTKDTSGTKEVLPLSSLLYDMNTLAPSALLRTLDDQYMLGSYADDVGSHLFLIFKVKDYNQAYASMLDWEKTLLRDVFMMFNIDVSTDRGAIFEKQWGDVIINNNNARILYDKNIKSVLYYIFPNKDNFIITDSQDTIKEITIRLLAKNTKPL